MHYPKGRYAAPISLDSANFDWVPVKGAKGVGAKGVVEKLFGVWTERRTQAGLFKLEKGARFEAAGHGVYLVLSGAGACAGNPLKQYTTVYVEADERATIEAGEETLLLHYGLPDLSDIEATGDTSGTLQAAE
jgi:hypothetical protein